MIVVDFLHILLVHFANTIAAVFFDLIVIYAELIF